MGDGRLSVVAGKNAIQSPYYRMTGRVIPFSETDMAIKVIVEVVTDIKHNDPYRGIVTFAAIDEDEVLANSIAEVSLTDVLANGYPQLILNARAAALDWANNTQGYSLSDSDIYSMPGVGGAAGKVVEYSGTVAGGAGAVSISISGFSQVDAVMWKADDDTALYSFGTLAKSTSAVSCVVKKQSTASANALINLLGGVTSFVTGVSQVNAPNATAVKAIVIGK